MTHQQSKPFVKATALSHLQTLVQAPSVTPSDAGLLDWLSRQLSVLGFTLTRLPVAGVDNLVAVKHFAPGPSLAFAGHVDVVPAKGSGWRAEPFAAAILDGAVYGRGTCDMKGGIAAMLAACQQFISDDGQMQERRGSLYWLITSDEEGEAEHGSKVIAEYLQQQGIALDACLVGEPTAELRVGDTIKNGRRGAISGRIVIKGKAGHVAYPQNTVNAAHLAGKIVCALAEVSWPLDLPGSSTSLQITGVNVANVVDNLVPASCEITFNIRYGHGYKGDDVMANIAALLQPWADNCDLQWERPCEPYYTGARTEGCFLSLVEHAIFQRTGQYPQLSTAGGTSDGRFFATGATQVIEVGVRNHTIHQVNEHLPLADLDAIEGIYYQILENYFSR
ncbi:succinyl-diaminopimelate desuccinylase [Pseudoalteromonas fenneropenaei]|uniref:Succinyl-diaminopimelate desuccinylase n=1 Tax=Pseudoalteromonas fenneropenaei TaxID=1737459 RepID=A0ABV7CLJ1_9GAMM